MASSSLVGLVVGKGTQFCDGNGIPLAGGSIQVLDASGSPATLYTDATAATALAATQSLDPGGRLVVSLWGVGTMTVQVLDSSGGLVAPVVVEVPKGPTGATGPSGATGATGPAGGAAGTWAPLSNGDVPPALVTGPGDELVLIQVY